MLETTGQGYVLNDDIVLRRIEKAGKCWAFNTADGSHYSLNETACWILEGLVGGLTPEELLDNFLSTYEVNHDQGSKDFQEIIQHFIEESILVRPGV